MHYFDHGGEAVLCVIVYEGGKNDGLKRNGQDVQKNGQDETRNGQDETKNVSYVSANEILMTWMIQNCVFSFRRGCACVVLHLSLDWA